MIIYDIAAFYGNILSTCRSQNVILVLAGSVRNAGDEIIVANIRNRIREFKIEPNVKFMINATYEQVLALLEVSSVGVHTMWNEHFGISVVEMMAAGLVVVAHNSGGPASDILVPFKEHKTGIACTVCVVCIECTVQINSLLNAVNDVMYFL